MTDSLNCLQHIHRMISGLLVVITCPPVWSVTCPSVWPVTWPRLQMVSELSSELADTRQQASLRLKTESDEAGLMRLRQEELEAELRQLRQQNRGQWRDSGQMERSRSGRVSGRFQMSVEMEWSGPSEDERRDVRRANGSAEEAKMEIM